MALLDTVVVGPLETNCYLFGDSATRQCAIIDPGGDLDLIADAIEQEDLRPEMILLTHAHFDHTGAVEGLKRRYGLRVGSSQAEARCLGDQRLSGAAWFGVPFEPSMADFFIADGDEIRVGSAKLRALATPGHSSGGLSFVGDGLVFVGDVLFREGVGRYDLPGSDFDELCQSLGRLLDLDDKTVVYPGHGPATTIGHERRHNPFLTDLPPRRK
ncbi:MBL fold metallo-hydrolase [Candidatus Sumerlaeota bacterium]|nr:MBL fold metallo-hydrolase [Candidatus Sumerlaeota bacterium]